MKGVDSASCRSNDWSSLGVFAVLITKRDDEGEDEEAVVMMGATFSAVDDTSL
jgi:hypothetical protein